MKYLRDEQNRSEPCAADVRQGFKIQDYGTTVISFGVLVKASMELFRIQTVNTARYTYRKRALSVLSLKLKLVVSYGLALKYRY